jgi:hypothetical protein
MLAKGDAPGGPAVTPLHAEKSATNDGPEAIENESQKPLRFKIDTTAKTSTVLFSRTRRMADSLSSPGLPVTKIPTRDRPYPENPLTRAISAALPWTPEG